MDYRARFYSQSLGRFIQPDTIIPNPSSPQGWNRFSYTLNNPLKYTDSTGHCVDGLTTIVCLGILSAVAGGLIGAGSYIINVSQSENKEIDIGELALAAGVGAASGVAITVGIMTANPMLVAGGTGAALSGTAYIADNVITGQEFDSTDFMIATGMGAISGIALPWAGIPINPITAGIAGAAFNMDQYIITKWAHQLRGDDDPITSEGVSWAIGTGLVGGMIEGLPGGKGLGKFGRSLAASIISNYSQPTNRNQFPSMMEPTRFGRYRLLHDLDQ